MLFSYSVAFNSLWPLDFSTPGFPVLHCLPEFAQSHVHWVGDAIQPSHPLSFPSLSTFNLSQHQGLFQWVGSSHQVAKVLEFQHQSFQWIFRIDFPLGLTGLISLISSTYTSALFFCLLLRYNWYMTLYQLQVYSEMIKHLCTLWDDHESG